MLLVDEVLVGPRRVDGADKVVGDSVAGKNPRRLRARKDGNPLKFAADQ